MIAVIPLIGPGLLELPTVEHLYIAKIHGMGFAAIMEKILLMVNVVP